jgi:dihydrofolate reductase
MSRNRVIGRDNRLPWRLPADLKRFKALTLGKPILMGRKTWESLPGLLPGRTHILLTRDTSYRASGCLLARSIEEAISLAGDVEEIMVVGGSQIYREMLPFADRLYITLVDAEFEGDTRFPEFDLASWREIEREDHESDEKNPYPHSFLTLEPA